jgi:hypothetical protein
MEYARSEAPIDDSLAPWMKVAVEKIRAGKEVTAREIEELQAMGTSF